MSEITRRALLKSGAAAGAGAIGLSSASGSVSAQSSGGFLLAPTGPGALLGVVHSLVTNNTAQGEALWDQTYADALEIEYRRNASLGSIENDAEMLADYLRLDVANAIVESAGAGNDNETVTTDSHAVLEEEVANLQKNLLNYWTVDFMALLRRGNWISTDDTGEITVQNIIRSSQITPSGGISYEPKFYEAQLYESALSTLTDDYADVDDPERIENGEAASPISSSSLSGYVPSAKDTSEVQDDITVDLGLTVTLANGEDYPIPYIWTNFYETQFSKVIDPTLSPVEHQEYDYLNNPSGPEADTTTPGRLGEIYASRQEGYDIPDEDFDHEGLRFRVFERQQDGEEVSGEFADLFNPYDFFKVWEKIEEVHTQESGNIQTLVDNLYEAAANGEITAAEIASGSAIKEAAQEGDDWQAAAGYYRSMGLAEADAPARIEIGGAVTAEGMLFRTRSNENTEAIPLSKTVNFSETVETDETDENGDPILEQVWPGELHAALEITAVESDDPLLDETGVNVGDVGTFNLTTHDVTIAESEEDPLTFEERGLFSPEDSTTDIIAALTDAYEQEQESRNGDTNITVDFDPGGIPGLPSVPDLSSIAAGAFLILGTIAVAIGITSGD